MESMGEPVAEVLTAQQIEHWTRYTLGGWALNNELRRRITEISELGDAQWRVLEVLASVPSMQISGLAEATQLGMSTVSRQVARSMSSGDIALVASPSTDGRQKWVGITEAGRALVDPVVRMRDEAIAELVLGEMNDDELRWLGDTFERIRLRCHV